MPDQIAVVDDEPLICDLVAEALRDHGAEIHCATTRDGGIALLVSRPFALALVDFMLPGGTGLPLAAAAANLNIPTLIISGQPDAAEQCERFGFPYLAKPFGLEALARETAKMLANRDAVIQQIRSATAKMDAEKKRKSD
jgi:two-component system NtrC family response regulator